MAFLYSKCGMPGCRWEPDDEWHDDVTLYQHPSGWAALGPVTEARRDSLIWTEFWWVCPKHAETLVQNMLFSLPVNDPPQPPTMPDG